MIQAHKDAVLTQLRAHPELAPVVYEGVVADRPARYCTVWTDSGQRTAERLAGSTVFATFTYIVHSVGRDPHQALWVADRVFAQLLDWTPDVPGFRCRRVRHTATVPVQRDPDGLPPVYFCVDEFTLSTQAL